MLAIQTDGTQPFLGEISPRISTEDVLIRVVYAGLCRTDVLASKGIISVPHHRILGHECSGTVIQAPTKSSLHKGQCVTINPLLKDGFIGLDRDGAFAQTIAVPPYAVFPIPDHLSLQKAAFTEPVAAALAIFQTNIQPQQKGLVLGRGRIADLTHQLLQIRGYKNVNRLSHPPEEEQFDFIVETNIHQQDTKKILKALKRNGLLVLKSRMKQNISLCTQLLIEKEIRIEAVRYGSFREAIELLASNQISTNYFGEVYSLTNFILHFDKCEEKKIFCMPNK